MFELSLRQDDDEEEKAFFSLDEDGEAAASSDEYICVTPKAMHKNLAALNQPIFYVII